MLLSNFGGYIAGAFKHKECQLCDENLLAEIEETALPTVAIAVFVEKPMPFLEEFFESILALEYPKSKLSLFIHNNVSFFFF